MYGGREKLHVPPSVGENVYLSLRKALHRQHIYCLALMRSKDHYEFLGLTMVIEHCTQQN